MKKMALLAMVFAMAANAGDEFVCQVDGDSHLAYSIQVSGSIGSVGTQGKTFDGFVESFDPIAEGGGLNTVAVTAKMKVTEGLRGTRTDGITFIDIVAQNRLGLDLSGELHSDAPFPFEGSVHVSPEQSLTCRYYPSSIGQTSFAQDSIELCDAPRLCGAHVCHCL